MLSVCHDSEHLAKFEELLEAAIDLERIPDEHLISAEYDPKLQVSKGGVKVRCGEVEVQGFC